MSGLDVRVGLGIDFHRLTAGRRLVLGGVEIPWQVGLAGHSDADVLLHAVCDALLGAAALGDIGHHFPPEDDRFAGIDSSQLLARVRELVAGSGYRPLQVDAVVLADRPKLAPHLPAMQARIAEVLGVEPGQVSVKATTCEGMGPVGRGEGMAAWAVALIRTAAPGRDR
ncbi:MAG: 2-C-methyl-D-erythritol 2,4-cyclodiphosphate synthase [Candidatus Bipolaricaulaceae bacterium]